MNYELFHVFPAILDIDAFLWHSVQPPALEVVDGGACFSFCTDGGNALLHVAHDEDWIRLVSILTERLNANARGGNASQGKRHFHSQDIIPWVILIGEHTIG